MERSLIDLDRAIDARIAKETEFINLIINEFRTITADMQRTASNLPPSQQENLQHYIELIDQATNKLDSRPAFGTNADLNGLVRSVTAPRPPPPGPPPPGSSIFSGLGSRLSNLMSPTPRPNAELQNLRNGYYEPDVNSLGNDSVTPNPEQDDGQIGRIGGKRRTRGGWKSKKNRRSKRPKF